MYGKDSEVTPYQRWLLAAFLGGGMGNLWDRLFRGFQVVDFMENRVYGLFGLEFWPVWNLADATLVISGCLLLLSMLAKSLHSRSKNSKNEH
jgi:signal peptidase II